MRNSVSLGALYGIAYEDAALKFLEKSVPDRKIRGQIRRKVEGLAAEPFASGARKLQNVTTARGEPVYRERSGDYRILFIIRSNPQQIIVLDIDNRKDVYR